MISQPAVAVSATPEAADSAPRAMAATSARRDGVQSSRAGSAVVAGPSRRPRRREGVEGEHPVRELDQGGPVRDHDHRAGLRQLADHPDQDRLRRGVEVGGRLVEEHHRPVTDQHPRQREPGPLARREPGAVLAELGLESRGQGEHDVRQVDALEGAPQAGVGGDRVGVPEVVRDRAGGQPRPLREPGHGGSPVVRGAVAGHPDRAVGGRQLAGDGGQQGRLATAGRADHGGQPDVEPGGQARHDRGTTPAEGDGLEHDAGLTRHPVAGGRGLVEREVDRGERRRTLRRGVELRPDPAHRPVGLGREQQHHERGVEVEGAGREPQADADRDQRDGEGGEQLEHDRRREGELAAWPGWRSGAGA